MIRTLLSHSFKSFFRSASAGKDVTIQIILGIIILIFVGYSLVLGFMLENIIVNVLHQNDAISFLNRLLIYYFIGEFITRYFIQNLPVLDVQPYMHLPISRSKIVNFLLGKSLIHVINIFVMLLFTPFAIKVIALDYGIGQALMWLLSLLLCSLLIHFIVMLVKRNLDPNAWGLFGFISFCLLIACADYFGWIKLSTVSTKFFNVLLQGYTVDAGLFLLFISMYYSAYRITKAQLYTDELSVQKDEIVHTGNWAFLQNFGLIGALINVEMKLIFRNKRSRQLFLMSVVFMLLPLGFYASSKNQDNYGVFLFYGIISSGFFTMNYGQFLFSWQGSHFDLTLVQPTPIKKFIESKYWLLTSAIAVWFLLSVPYLFLGWYFLLINLVASLFNIGVNTFIIMNMAMWEPKKINLKHSGSLNYEGIGAAQWLMGFPVMACPYLFYIPFSATGYPMLGLVSVGMAGVIGIIFRNKIINYTTQRLSVMRYKIASNFRKD